MFRNTALFIDVRGERRARCLCRSQEKKAKAQNEICMRGKSFTTPTNLASQIECCPLSVILISKQQCAPPTMGNTHTHTHTLVHVSFPHSVSSGLRTIPIAVVTVHNSGPSASISSDYGAIPRLATFPPATPALPRQVTPRRQGQSPCEAAIYYSSDVPPRDQIQPVSDR